MAISLYHWQTRLWRVGNSFNRSLAPLPHTSARWTSSRSRSSRSELDVCKQPLFFVDLIIVLSVQASKLKIHKTLVAKDLPALSSLKFGHTFVRDCHHWLLCVADLCIDRSHADDTVEPVRGVGDTRNQALCVIVVFTHISPAGH